MTSATLPRVKPTRRLRFEPFAPRHARTLLGVFRDEHVRRHLLDGELVDVDWVRAEIRASQARFAEGSLGLWLARSRRGGAPVGFVGFRPFFEPPALQLLYGLLPEHCGRGLATEMAAAAVAHAFSTGMDTVRATIDEPNVASIRLIRRLGFRRSGSTGEPQHRQLHFRLRRSRYRPTL